MPVILPLNCNAQVMPVSDTLVLYFANSVTWTLFLANPLFCCNAVLQMVSQEVGCYKKVPNVNSGVKEDDLSNINKRLPNEILRTAVL